MVIRSGQSVHEPNSRHDEDRADEENDSVGLHARGIIIDAIRRHRLVVIISCISCWRFRVLSRKARAIARQFDDISVPGFRGRGRSKKR